MRRFGPRPHTAARSRPIRDFRTHRGYPHRQSARTLDRIEVFPLSCPVPSPHQRSRAMGQVVSELITLIVVVDPLAASSVFLAVTVGCSAATKRKIATLSVVISFGVLLFF